MISIIVPVYNTEKYLGKCIDSILSQTFTDFELLLVDDGSTDKSGYICDEYAKIDDRIIVYHNENRGVSYSRNFGLDRAKGDYIGWVDSDDWILPTMYEELINVALNNNLDFVMCDFNFVYKDSIIYNKGVNKCDNKKEWIVNYLQMKYNVLVATLVKRKIYEEYNIRCNELYNFSEDFNVSTKLLYKSNNIYHLEKAFYMYNKYNLESITTDNPYSIEKIISKIYNTEDVIKMFSKDDKKKFNKYIYWRVLMHKREIIQNANSIKDVMIYSSLSKASNEYIFSNPNPGRFIKLIEYLLSKKIYIAYYIYKYYFRKHV